MIDLILRFHFFFFNESETEQTICPRPVLKVRNFLFFRSTLVQKKTRYTKKSRKCWLAFLSSHTRSNKHPDWHSRKENKGKFKSGHFQIKTKLTGSNNKQVMTKRRRKKSYQVKKGRMVKKANLLSLLDQSI